MDWESIFGEEALTREQFEEKVKGFKLVDLTDGEYVGKGKLDAALKAKAEAVKAAEEARKQLDGDDGLKAEVARLTTELAAKDKSIEEATKSAEEAKAESNRATRERAVLKRGIDPKVSDFVLYKAEQLVSDEVEFDTALDKFLADNPDYATAPSVEKISGKPTEGRPDGDSLIAAIDKAGWSAADKE